MESYMATDLSALYQRDMPKKAKIYGKEYTVLLGDSATDEIEAYGGPESVATQEVRFLRAELEELEDGTVFMLEGKSKIVLTTTVSADGNEIIARVRGD